MVKILSKSGDSLADVYDVKGSIAGIDQLESREVSLVHEMGSAIFSERFSGAIRRSTTGDILQNVSFDGVFAGLPANMARILGVVVFVIGDSGRVSFCSVNVRDEAAGREVPIFAWEAGQQITTVRLEEEGVVANVDMLVAGVNAGHLPSMLVGSQQPQRIGMSFRGRSTGFGAGNVEIVTQVYLLLANIGGISSRGLPVPGW